MELFEITFEPDGKVARMPKGATILEAAPSAGVHIEGPCGGKATCGKCRVVGIGKLSELSPSERRHLSEEEIKASVRLACQAVVLGDVTVEIPRTTRLLTQKILDYGVGTEVSPVVDVYKYPLKLAKPTLEDQRTDLERIKDALPRDGIVEGLDVLKRIPHVIRDNDFQVTAVIVDNELIDVESGDTSRKSYGISFDIGTTTVVGYLIDLTTGEQMGVSAAMNPQVIHGDDVISRINFVIENRNGLKILHRKIVNCLNELIVDLTGRLGINPINIYEATVAGNTCMHHLFLGIDPRNIAPNPFVPVVSEPICVHAGELALKINRGGHVHVLPNIAGYVGADIVGDILASDLLEGDEPRLLVDIGTNGEVVLGFKERIIACSAAAGPAFEGARISCGMRGAAGAIDKVAFDEDVDYTTIDNAKPKGVCGSGLLDVAAEMLRVGIVDPTGRIMDRESSQISAGERIRKRIERGEDGARFLLIRGEETDDGRPIYITQRDIRELQLAKGAIRTGIEVLMRELDITAEDLAEILLAGAFGNYLRKESALAVGLLPPIPLERIKSLGNAAGEGAKMALISREERDKAEVVARKVRYIELSARKDFMDAFTEGMFFPTS